MDKMKHFLVCLLTAIILQICESRFDFRTSPYYDIRIFQSAQCSNGFIYRLPLTGGCQQVLPWIREEGWNMGVSVPKHLHVRFYADEYCSETMEMTKSDNSINEATNPPSDCLTGDLEGFGLKAKSLRLVADVIN